MFNLFYGSKPYVGKKVRIDGKKQLEKLKALGYECILKPRTEHVIDGYNEKLDCPMVKGYTLTHRGMYTVLRGK